MTILSPLLFLAAALVTSVTAMSGCPELVNGAVAVFEFSKLPTNCSAANTNASIRVSGCANDLCACVAPGSAVVSNSCTAMGTSNCTQVGVCMRAYVVCLVSAADQCDADSEWAKYVEEGAKLQAADVENATKTTLFSSCQTWGCQFLNWTSSSCTLDAPSLCMPPNSSTAPTTAQPTTMATTGQPATGAPTIAVVQETKHAVTLSGDWVQAIANGRAAVVLAAATFIANALGISTTAVIIDSVAAGSLIVNYRATTQIATSSINALVSAGSTAALETAYFQTTGITITLAVTGTSTVVVQQNTRSCGGGCIALVLVGLAGIVALIAGVVTLVSKRTAAKGTGQPAGAQQQPAVTLAASNASPIRHEFEQYEMSPARQAV